MEVLGTYDPIPRKIPYSPPGSKKVKDIQLDMSRARYWLGVGAQPSEPAWRLMSMLGLLEPRYANGKYNGKPTIIDEPQIVDQIWNNYNDMLDEGNQNHKQWEEAQEEGQTASTKNEEASATKSL
ncbi:MAG: 37S ribosomal protein S16, mitochondrial [Vezdaea aestivalis]|nr:MAG: 37S ribosomal protein S16, mitochondrial [Vezdaea aestivalis]